MAAFSTVKKDYLKFRRRAVKKDIPDLFLYLADRHANKALWFRELATLKSGDRNMNRSINEMLHAIEALRVFLFPCRFPTPLIALEVHAKWHRKLKSK